MTENHKKSEDIRNSIYRTTQGSDEDLPNSLKPILSNSKDPGKIRSKRNRIRETITGIRWPWRSNPKVTTAAVSAVDPRHENQFALPARNRPCRVTFIFDPAGKLCYYWSVVVSVAFLYNLWIISYRFAFQEITTETMHIWFSLDYSADFIYFLDLLMGFRTGFLNEDGVLQTNPKRIRLNFVNTSHFYLSCLSLLPIDFLYLSIQFRSIVRCIRLVKVYRFVSVIDVSERHTNHPSLFRGAIVVHSVFLVFHWNACLIYTASKSASSSENWLKAPKDSWNSSDMFYTYMKAQFLSCGLLLPTAESYVRETNDKNRIGICILALEQIVGVLLFAIVIGYVATIISNLSSPRKQFQSDLDNIKTYMRVRRVPTYLQMKVIRWFDYLWSFKQSGHEDSALQCLPNRLKAEIALQVHLDTLKRVEIFRNTEPGFLVDLVLRLSPLLFSPGDYVCRRGEVGTEMYIVNRGKLFVMSDDGKTVLATLKAGSYFGEISLLNLGTGGNRRTASVISVGYSNLFCLSKKDIWEVLEDYPAARDRLEQIAHRRLVEMEGLAHGVRQNYQNQLNCTTNPPPTSPDSAYDHRESTPRSLVHSVAQSRTNSRLNSAASKNDSSWTDPDKLGQNSPPSLHFVQTTDESYI